MAVFGRCSIGGREKGRNGGEVVGDLRKKVLAADRLIASNKRWLGSGGMWMEGPLGFGAVFGPLRFPAYGSGIRCRGLRLCSYKGLPASKVIATVPYSYTGIRAPSCAPAGRFYYAQSPNKTSHRRCLIRPVPALTVDTPATVQRCANRNSTKLQAPGRPPVAH